MRRWYWWSLSRWILRSSMALLRRRHGDFQVSRRPRQDIGGTPGEGRGEGRSAFDVEGFVARIPGTISLILGRDPTGVVAHVAAPNMGIWTGQKKEEEKKKRSRPDAISFHVMAEEKCISNIWRVISGLVT